MRINTIWQIGRQSGETRSQYAIRWPGKFRRRWPIPNGFSPILWILFEFFRHPLGWSFKRWKPMSPTVLDTLPGRWTSEKNSARSVRPGLDVLSTVRQEPTRWLRRVSRFAVSSWYSVHTSYGRFCRQFNLALTRLRVHRSGVCLSEAHCDVSNMAKERVVQALKGF